MPEFITVRNEVAKVMFLYLSVILFTGGGLPQCMLGYPPGSRHPPEQTHPLRSRHPPGGDIPPRSRHPWEETSPREQTPLQDQAPPLGPGTPRDQASPQHQAPPRSRPPPGRRLPLRTVRILLECILVEVIFSRRGSNRRERGKTKIYAQSLWASCKRSLLGIKALIVLFKIHRQS